MNGIVKKLLREKGFGFLRDDQTGQEHFFHQTGCDDSFYTLEEGTKVTFEEGQMSPKGPRAEHVRKAD